MSTTAAPQITRGQVRQWAKGGKDMYGNALARRNWWAAEWVMLQQDLEALPASEMAQYLTAEQLAATAGEIERKIADARQHVIDAREAREAQDAAWAKRGLERCDRCGGSGRYGDLGECWGCGGHGTVAAGSQS